MASGTSKQRDTEQQSPTAGDVTEEIGAAASEASESVQAAASELTETFQQRITSQVTTQQERAVDTLETVALLLQQAGEHARKEDKAGIAQYADQAAQQVERLSTAIRDREPDQLLTDTRQLAQQRPGLFLGGALLAGFLGARFLRSSAQAQQTTNGQASNQDTAAASDQQSSATASGTSDLDVGTSSTETDTVSTMTGTDTRDDTILDEDATILTDLADEELLRGDDNAFGGSGSDAGADLPDTERL